MRIKLVKSYPNRNADGTAKVNKQTGRNAMTFMYTVHGSKEELESYKEAQGGNEPEGDDNHYREDESGTPLYFTQRPVGKTGEIKISNKGSVFIDTTDLDLATSMIENYGSAGVLMAKDILNLNPVHAPSVTRQSIDSANPEAID